MSKLSPDFPLDGKQILSTVASVRYMTQSVSVLDTGFSLHSAYASPHSRNCQWLSQKPDSFPSLMLTDMAGPCLARFMLASQRHTPSNGEEWDYMP